MIKQHAENDVLFKLIRELEIELIESETRSNTQHLSDLIHDEFKEIGASGRVYNKIDSLKEIQSNPNSYQASDFSFKRLSTNCILTQYQTISKSRKVLRTSIWKKEKDHWQMLHHQGTIVHS